MSARGKPIVLNAISCECVEQAEGIENIGRRPCEMISVILLCQESYSLVIRPFVFLCQSLDCVNNEYILRTKSSDGHTKPLNLRPKLLDGHTKPFVNVTIAYRDY